MRPQFGQYPHHYLTVCSISFYQPELVTARRGQHQSGIFSFAGGRLRAFHPAFPRPSTYRNTASGAADLSRLLACRAQHRSRSKVSDSDNNVLPSTLPENCDIESRRPSTIAFRWRATPTPRGNVGVPEGGGMRLIPDQRDICFQPQPLRISPAISSPGSTKGRFS